MSGDIFSSKASINYSTTTASEEKVNYAVGCYVTAKSKGKDEAGIAKYIRDEFNRKFEVNWHCIVGKGYSHYTEADTGCKIKFTIGGETVYLFRHTTTTEPKPSPRHYPHISPSDREMITKSRVDTEMEYHVLDCCRTACDWYTSNTERVKYIVDEFDKEHNGGWNGILGGNFASAVGHKHNCYIYINNFGKENVNIRVFRC